MPRGLFDHTGPGHSPVHAETPLLGAEVAVDPGFEHGVLVDTGRVEFDGVPLDRAAMGVRDAGLGHLRLTNPTDRPARVMLLGGEPFDEGIVMWWNFIGRSHDDILRLRREWNEAPDDRLAGCTDTGVRSSGSRHPRCRPS